MDAMFTFTPDQTSGQTDIPFFEDASNTEFPYGSFDRRSSQAGRVEKAHVEIATAMTAIGATLTGITPGDYRTPDGQRTIANVVLEHGGLPMLTGGDA